MGLGWGLSGGAVSVFLLETVNLLKQHISNWAFQGPLAAITTETSV